MPRRRHVLAGGALNDFWALDLPAANWTQLSGQPKPRYSAGFATDGDSLYVLGGSDSSGAHLPTRAQSFRIRCAGLELKCLGLAAAAPTASALAPAGVLLNDLRMYNPASASWADLTGSLSGLPPLGRRFAGSAVTGDKLYIFGGFGSGGDCGHDVEISFAKYGGLCSC